MGLEEDRGHGENAEDIKLILKVTSRKTTRNTAIFKKAQQRLHFLRVLKRNNICQRLLVTFYRSTIESTLAYCIAVWFSTCTEAERKRLHRVFNPASPLSSDDPYYNPDPSLEDRVHVLVCVLSANMVDIKAYPLDKIKDIREAASDLGIPQVAILTKSG
ncbi:unnamed protein product [Tetraodon nigroviridis]|uniref:(spotted green pufferfish) hypothetical protein n=1 Tax=Tetraodon nigroviridis TaxID=99883 RepID=Q4SRR7_TETNG|nr:unnamed protein product [Tetraodon nigroviridis]